MKANDILNKIKNIVGVELSETVDLAEITLWETRQIKIPRK